MVSPLSSRILNLEAKAKSINCPLLPSFDRSSRKIWNKDSTQVKRANDHSTGGESSCFNVTSVGRSKRTERVKSHTKKRNIDELDNNIDKHVLYSSAMIRSRNLPHRSKDTVRLITVSRDTPYIEEITATRTELFDISVYSDLVQLSEQFYRIHESLTSIPTKDSDKDIMIDQEVTLTSYDGTDSSRSLTLSDEESEDETTTGNPAAKFDDIKKFQDAKSREIDAANSILKGAILCSTVGTSNLEEILDNQNSPR